ncbi:MAG: hypothetical protein [Caudoviricetes sp.]|nr:MAG: hypothetical protein [Caudoviricetes sp.]
MLENILHAFQHEGYDAYIKDGIVIVSLEEFDLYRVFVEKTIFLHSVDTGRTLNFKDYDEFLYFLES